MAAPSVIETAEQAMFHLKAHRVWGLAIGVTIVSTLTAVLVLVLEGDRFAAHVHAAALIASALLNGTYVIAFRDPRRHRSWIAFALLVSSIPVMLSGYYYWGVFSTYTAVVLLTIFIAADAADSSAQVLIGCGLAVAAQAGFACATAIGWIEPRGLIGVVRGSLATQLVAVGLIQMMTIGAAFFANDARRRTSEVFADHTRALRILARRAAQVDEAHAEADEARRAGGGRPGRFSGQTLGGFVLDEVLGRGGMGEVYAATRDGTPCAVKVLAPHLLRNPTAYGRFERESAMLCALESPHVVKVLGVSTATAALPFVAMERLSGIDLAQLLKTHGTLALATTVEIVNQVARGLDAAHGAGVIHRDLKPQNLFAIGPDGARTWKLIDFGVAKWADGESSLTAGHIVGTPGYMAPEQAGGHAVDARSDLYALGVIVYRMVTGVPAVTLGEVPRMLHEVVYRMPAAPSSVVDVPAQVEAVLAVALAKQPADRFASAAELAAALEDAAADRLAPAIWQRASLILAAAPWGAWIER